MRQIAILTFVCGLGLGLQPALAQTPAGTDKAFCTEGSGASGARECRYDTMAQCEATAKGQVNVKCVQNPKMAPAKK